MSVLERLAACAGEWRGTSQLQDPSNNLLEESSTTATVTPVLGGKFVRLDYTWDYQGKPQEGTMLIGYRATAGVVTAQWADTWHMGDTVMACQGDAGTGDEISVRGSYAAPPGPDWGWRIVVTPGDGQLGIVMFNIWPEGREELAVESHYTRG